MLVPSYSDGRRAGDLVLGYIRICRSFPLSDLVIDVPNTAI